MSDRPTAIVLMVGSELLAGRFPEQNSPALIRLLAEQGVQLLRLLLLPDTLPLLVVELNRARVEADHVIACGGLGPTHDDRTMEAVALALGVPVIESPELRALLERRYGAPLGAGHSKLARLPEGSQLHYGGPIEMPLITCRNMMMLPGVPELFHAKLATLRSLLAGRVVCCRRLVVTAPEAALAELLAAIEAAHVGVALGSYPRGHGLLRRVELVLEGAEESAVNAAALELTAALCDAGWPAD